MLGANLHKNNVNQMLSDDQICMVEKCMCIKEEREKKHMLYNLPQDNIN